MNYLISGVGTANKHLISQICDAMLAASLEINDTEVITSVVVMVTQMSYVCISWNKQGNFDISTINTFSTNNSFICFPPNTFGGFNYSVIK
jgi:hypothetical protein